MYITKYINSGVNPLVILSPAKYTSCDNSGLILAFINNGTTVADNILHFTIEFGQKIFATHISTNVSNISPIPVNFNPPINDEIKPIRTRPI